MANQSAARAKVPFKRRVQARVMNTANIGITVRRKM